jgi:hypothetical protein
MTVDIARLALTVAGGAGMGLGQTVAVCGASASSSGEILLAGPMLAAFLAAEWRARAGGPRRGVMVTKPLTMIKGTLPRPVSFDPPDR